MMMLHSVWSGGGSAAGRKVLVVLALLALAASVLVWSAPGSQAQANRPPSADAGMDQTAAPGDGVTLDGSDSIDIDGTGSGECAGCEYEWEIGTGPYDYLPIGEASGTAQDDATTPAAFFTLPSQAFIDKISDSDPGKYEIVVQLTVTDDDGATDTDTMTIRINQRPAADIGVYAGLRDKSITDGDLGAMGHFPVDAVIDGPGENGNRDNEWDVKEGAYLVLDGSASTDEGATGAPAVYQWTLVRPSSAPAGYAQSQTVASRTGQRLVVAVDNNDSANTNVEVINFGDLDGDGTANEAANAAADPPQIAETISVAKLPQVAPNAPQTVFYQLTVCDAVAQGFTGADITDDNDTDCTGQTGSALVRIVVHDTTADPEVSIDAGLTAASRARGDADPQETVSQVTGVENQFLVVAGSAVVLTAAVKDADQPAGTAHRFRWSGATSGADPAKAVVRVPSDASSGDTIDVSVTVTDATRRSVTAAIQLKVTGANAKPTAEGVPANKGSIDNPATGDAVIWVHAVGDGFQNAKVGSTVTLRGVGNDPDGDSIITAWAQREGPDHDALHDAITTWLAASAADGAVKAQVDGAALGVVGAALQDMQEPDTALLELEGELTDTVSFEVPNLRNGETKGTILLFSVIDSNGASDAQIVYVHVTGDDDLPDADAGPDQQVDPGSFVRLNGSASSDPDVGDKVSHMWEYVGASMDPAPDDRPPLSASEVDGLDGWILKKADDGTWDYIVKSDRTREDGVMDEDFGKLMSAGNPYPWFDAPSFTGFNNIKLTFRLTVTDSFGRDFNSDGDDLDTVDGLDETSLMLDLNGDGDMDDTSVDGVVERTFGNQDTDTVVITVVNRFFSGTIPGPDYCTGKSLGGPQTHPFDSDKDGVADTCSLDTTRRATVARQNALETLANLNPAEFRTAVLGVCGAAGFKQRNYGDDPSDLGGDVCETQRVAPPPAGADPATAEMFFSGTITGVDFCTNHSLGGARTYAFDSDRDGVADVCSLPTTKREAIARQNGLQSFIEAFTPDERTRHDEIAELIALTGNTSRTDKQTARMGVLNEKYAKGFEVAGAGTAGTLEAGDEVAKAQAEVDRLAAKKAKAARYDNALAAACRALGTQDFGDAPSATARDACAPTSGPTGRPLN